MAIDQGQKADWGRTARDYLRYRSGPPPSFYQKLAALGVGLEDQKILDLGTGTGFLARHFAAAGANAAGVDISEHQIVAARHLADKDHLKIDFRVSIAEETPFQGGTFDCVTANQAWMYFDAERILDEVKRLLRQDGLLAISHFSWLPRVDRIAHATEALILKHNPEWSSSGWSGAVPPSFDFMHQQAVLRGMFFYDCEIPFTREQWRGRIRACRGVGATLTDAQITKFDEQHEELLLSIADDNFTVLHRLDAHVYSFRSFDKKHFG